MEELIVILLFIGAIVLFAIFLSNRQDDPTHSPPVRTTPVKDLAPADMVDWGPHGGPGRIRVSSGSALRDGRDKTGDGFSSQIMLPRTFPADLKEAVNRYGEIAVFKLFRAQITIKCQQHVRALMEAQDYTGQFLHNDQACIRAGQTYTPPRE